MTNIKVTQKELLVKGTKDLEKSVAADLKKPDKKLRDVLSKLDTSGEEDESNE